MIDIEEFLSTLPDGFVLNENQNLLIEKLRFGQIKNTLDFYTISTGKDSQEQILSKKDSIATIAILIANYYLEKFCLTQNDEFVIKHEFVIICTFFEDMGSIAKYARNLISKQGRLLDYVETEYGYTLDFDKKAKLRCVSIRKFGEYLPEINPKLIGCIFNNVDTYWNLTDIIRPYSSSNTLKLCLYDED